MDAVNTDRERKATLMEVFTAICTIVLAYDTAYLSFLPQFVLKNKE